MAPDTDLGWLLDAAGWPLVPLVPAAMLAVATSGVPVDVGSAGYVGLVLFAVGLALWLWAVVALLMGGSSPVGTPPDELVTAGPYGHSRNPMFLGVVVAVLGEAVVFSSVVAAALAVVVWWLFDRVVVDWEERHNARALGDDYERYRERVPRWFGPL